LGFGQGHNFFGHERQRPGLLERAEKPLPGFLQGDVAKEVATLAVLVVLCHTR
jgi:hypothetical protein